MLGDLRVPSSRLSSIGPRPPLFIASRSTARMPAKKVICSATFIVLPWIVSSHTALVWPVSRNAMDRHLPQFEGGKSPDTPCTCSNGYENEYPAHQRTTVSSGACWADVGFNYNNHEHNIKTVGANSTAECCSLCNQLTNCSFYTLFEGHCYLKSSDVGRVELSGAVSGGTGARPPLPPTPDGRCDGGVRAEGGSGQPCLWWSQGCSIGCPVCATIMSSAHVGSRPCRAAE